MQLALLVMVGLVGTVVVVGDLIASERRHRRALERYFGAQTSAVGADRPPLLRRLA